MRALLSLGLSLLLAGVACAGGTMKSLTSMDENRAWGAVGRLELDGKGFCTGALIAPDLVLTAAHCLFDRETGAQITPQNIQFRAGWRNGRAIAYRDVRRAIKHPRYEYDAELAGSRVANDLALLELRHAVASSGLRPFRTDDRVDEGDIVGLVSYAAGRSEVATLQEICEVVRESREVLVLSCEVEFGASGAPVFRFDEDGPRIVSVISAKAELDGQRVAIGAPLTRNLDVLWDALLAADERGFEAPPGVKSVRVTRFGGEEPGVERQIGGAKFVRP